MSAVPVRQPAEIDPRSRVARLVRGEIRPRRKFAGPLCKRRLRQREIEKLIKERYGGFLPEELEAESLAFIRAAAYAINALGPDLLPGRLRDWCRRWAPWSVPRLNSIILPVLNELDGRKYDLGADDVARLLGVTLGESRVNREKPLRTIGACDVSEKIRKGNAKLRKRKRDADRQAKLRLAQGRKPWSQSLSRTRPWEEEGISRRTWERRRKSGEISVVADVSRIGTPTKGSDTFATTSPLGSSVPVLAGRSKEAPSLPCGNGADSADGGTGRTFVEDERRVTGVSA